MTGGFIMQNRRAFIKNLAAGSVGVGLLGEAAVSLAAQSNEYIKLTVLHTNDWHSHIDPFPADAPRHANEGGIARRSALINQIRKEEENVLLLDAGDVFQGTPYFNFYKGKIEFELMSEIGYDAATIGNHEFDNGLEGIDSQLPHAKFPFICSNYDFSDTILAGKTIPNKVFERGGLRIGVYGLGVELDGLVAPDNFGKTRYLDPLKVALEQEKLLREQQGADMVICLSHLGYKYRSDKVSDQIIADNTYATDLIIGGHTHTFLEHPEMHTNKANKQILVNQVGWAGLLLGRIDFYVTRRGHAKSEYTAIPIK